MKMIGGFPRRNRLDLNTATELLIRKAVEAVEGLGADPKLTKAVILLSQALDKVADYTEDAVDAAVEAFFRSLPPEGIALAVVLGMDGKPPLLPLRDKSI